MRHLAHTFGYEIPVMPIGGWLQYLYCLKRQLYIYHSIQNVLEEDSLSLLYILIGLIQSDAGERRTCVFTIQRKIIV